MLARHLVICAFGALLALQVYSGREVVVEVTASVDAELNIERINNYGSINLFNHQAEEYRITNNTTKGVKVSLRSHNSWHMTGAEDKFAYSPVINGTELVATGDVCTYDIDKQLFDSNKQYKLLVAFRALPGALKDVKAGEYHDSVTINIELN